MQMCFFYCSEKIASGQQKRDLDPVIQSSMQSWLTINLKNINTFLGLRNINVAMTYGFI